MENLEPAEFDMALLVFRVLFGLIFAAHGYAKMFRGGKIAGTAGWFDSIGMKPGKIHAVAASVTEMGTGVLIALGFFTPLAAAGIIGVMLVAGWTVHRSSGFFIVGGGWEYSFIVALMAFLVAGIGPGQWSLDAAFGLDETLVGYTGMAIALIVGIVAGIGQLVVFYRPPATAAEAA
ncbi:MAG: DoxX family protein [Actinomycetia bacterium]|nr:DoxX family protein [Actinomycetes bacterium]